MNKNQRILIIGAEGQLGSEFHQKLEKQNYSYLAPKEKDCNFTNSKQIREIFETYKPTIVINCAAYNAVEAAEENKELAYSINSHAVKNLAELADSFDCKLIHYSSDYVFDGTKQDLYIEEDPTNPLNIYGKSKLEGERAVLQCSPNFLVFRLSWVIGRGSQNFLFKLSNWAKDNKILKISSDEVSVPTFTDEIVKLTLLSIEKELSGLYHMTNSGYASRYELARFYASQVKLDNIFVPVAMSNFQSTTKRPLFSAMSNTRLSDVLNIGIPDWKEGLVNFFPKG